MAILKYKWVPAKSYTPGRTHPISSIILHSTDGGMPGCLDTLTGTSPAVSAHWLVDRDGTLYHLVDDSNTAYHAGIVDNPSVHGNGATVGVEQEHIDGEEPWPEALVEKTAQLVAALRQRHGSLPVLSHASVATFTMSKHDYGRKSDPREFPFDKLHNLVAAAMKETWTFEKA